MKDVKQENQEPDNLTDEALKKIHERDETLDEAMRQARAELARVQQNKKK